ncbi:hypothetical protein EU527_09675 [Candidatus Thorarchaeota archaeon]|nr:MAG: hypothetical protein EU527_09675 [Candidatus Thorarchaeota archaeon]
MRTCASCGKANNPTRKFCLRCGKPLYPDKETKKEVAHTISSNSHGVQRAAEQLERVVTPNHSQSIAPKVTTDDQWVKPSEVSKDRVRTTTPTAGKSEMEKAREAFAKAEQVGITEESGDIVETRMLRASEVQELMEGLSKQQETASPPTQPTQIRPPHEEMAVISPEKPPEIRTAPPPSPPVAPSPDLVKESVIEEPRPVRHIAEEVPTHHVQEERKVPPPRTPIVETDQKSAPMTEDISKKPMPELDAIVSEITNPEFLQDQLIRETINDLINLHTEVKHYEADLRYISDRLDKESKDCWNKAEVKRIHFESLEEQLRLSKQEWTDASKVFQNAEKRRKDEVSSREKHIKDLQKRISKTEDNIRKRVKDLEKERES